MREISFKGFCKELNQWVYGYYVKKIKLTPCVFKTKSDREEWYKENTVHLIVNDGFSDYCMPRELEMHIVEEESIGQSTGCIDCNMKEIYEGDIVRLNGATYNVVYDNCGMFNLDGFYDSSYDYPSIAFSENTNRMEVIGNKYCMQKK